MTMLASKCGHHFVDRCTSCNSALDCTNQEILRLHSALDTERTRADEAEKRERELREAVGKTFREIEHSMKQAAILGNDKMREIRLTTNIVQAAMKALIQPEPDPLVEKIGALLQNDPACNGRVTCDTIERIAAIVKGES